MSKHNRTNWQTGMEITPQVFIDADNFHIEQQNITRRLRVMPCYGLLPQSVFNMELIAERNILSINNLVIQAVTPQGELIDVDEHGKEFAKLDMEPYRKKTQLYVNISGTLNCEIVENPSGDSSGMTIAKIDNMVLDQNYIPPCISINSNLKLTEIHTEICGKASDIMAQINGDERFKAIFLPLALLDVELKNYSTFESPADLFLLVKKIAMSFKSISCEGLELANTEKLLHEAYCHTNIRMLFSRVLEWFHQLEEKIKIAEEPEEKAKISRIQIAID